MKSLIYSVSGFIAVLLIALFARILILGGASSVRLSTDPIAYPLAKSLQGPSNYRPIAGKDYTVSSVKYFDNNQWAAVSIAPIGTFSDSGIVVLENKAGDFRAVLGPGSSFVGADLSSLPQDVRAYLSPDGGTQ